MKKYLLAESYGLGDKLYTDAIVKELLRLPDTEKIAIIVSKAGGNLKMPFYDGRVELYPFVFAWNRRRGQRNPVRLLGSIITPRMKLGKKFSGYEGLCPRGDLWQYILLKLLGANPVISYKFSRGETFIERILGWSKEPVMDARTSFARMVSDGLVPHSQFLREDNASKRSGEVFLAPEASAQKRELEESKWIEISRELKRMGWKPILVVHSNTVVKPVNYGEFSEVLDLPVLKLIERAQGVEFAIAVDSFIGHLLAACGAKVVSIFGPQRPDIWAPAAGDLRIVSKRFPCSPCNKELAECPYYAKGGNCMQSIVAKDVLEAFFDLAGRETP